MNNDHKIKLEEEKSILLGQLQTLGKYDAKNGEWQATSAAKDESDADPNSNADRFEDFEENSALMTPLTARLAQVEDALSKIEKGSYGICRVCSNPIEEERLNANPAAETCMKHLEA